MNPDELEAAVHDLRERDRKIAEQQNVILDTLERLEMLIHRQNNVFDAPFVRPERQS